MSAHDTSTVKVIELVGESEESWEDAAEQALRDASETIEDVSGIDIVNQTASVEDDEIVQYRSTVHVTFPIER
jgi:flavin-binding protein dodecin